MYFLDTNVLVDYVTKREPHYEFSKRLFKAFDERKEVVSTSIICMTTTIYFAQKNLGNLNGRRAIQKLKELVEVFPALPVNLDWALESRFDDLEDGIQNSIAESSGCTAIITRNKKDFKHSSLAILTPEELLATL